MYIQTEQNKLFMARFTSKELLVKTFDFSQNSYHLNYVFSIFLAEFGWTFIKPTEKLMLLSRLLLSIFILFAQAAVEKPL